MTPTPLVERARNSRSSGAVLKVQVSNVRSRDGSIPILVFEGHTDLAPYRVWMSRISDSFVYVAIGAKGKSQVLDLRRRLQADSARLGDSVYFLVDRDFDELKGQSPGSDIYCTDGYSIENYLVSEEVLQNLLTEEFRCPDEENHRQKIIRMFSRALDQFLEKMLHPNRRLFHAGRLMIKGNNVVETIARYVDISLNGVERIYSDDEVRVLVPLEREPTDQETLEIDAEFNSFDRRMRYRGKFILNFFMRWLELLALGRSDPALFMNDADIRFSTQKLSLDSLAGRARVPASLRDFVISIRPRVD